MLKYLSAFALRSFTANTAAQDCRRHSSTCLLLLHPLQLLRYRFLRINPTVKYVVIQKILVLQNWYIIFLYLWLCRPSNTLVKLYLKCDFLFLKRGFNYFFTHFLFPFSGTGSFRPIQTRLAPCSRPSMAKTSPPASSSAVPSQLSSTAVFIH